MAARDGLDARILSHQLVGCNPASALLPRVREVRGRRETQPSVIMNVKNVATISTRYIRSPTDMAHLVVSAVINQHEGMTEIAL
jgi:hypothetical protein